MLPLTHGKLVNPLILAHISRADDLASVSLASILQPRAFVATGQELESSTALTKTAKGACDHSRPRS
jgi:hypothetical protein